MGRVTASLDDLPLRDDLRGLTPYGAPQAPLPIALNVNENTHPIPDEVASDILDEIAVAIRDVNRYPDREFTALREGFAEYLGHGLEADDIWAGNGSNEVLQHILQAFGGPGRTAFGFAPTYSMYPLIAQGTGARWVAGTRQPDYTITPEEAAAQVRAVDPDVVLLCSPNNPTGTPLGLDVVEAVYEVARGVVVVDEAYQEFAPREAPSALSLLAGRPRLAVSRTMSKAFAFAGVRLGYLAADAAVVDALRLVRLPYHLSALTQAAATTAVRHAGPMLATVADIRVQRDRLAVALLELGYRVHDSGANFLLVGGFADPAATFTALRERGILIRDLSIEGHLRMTAGTEAETTTLIAALTELAPNDR